MSVYVSVGNTVVGTFNGKREAYDFCFRELARGLKPRIKKCRYTGGSIAAKRASNEAWHEPNQTENYKRYPRMLKPGEFHL